MQQVSSPTCGIVAETAERTVIASALLMPDVADSVRDVVSPHDFTLPEHRLVFQAICEASREPRGETDLLLIAVAEQLERAGELAAVGGAVGLKAMADWSAVSAAADYYASQVRMAATARRLAIETQDVGRGIHWENLPQAAEKLQAMAEFARSCGSPRRQLRTLDMSEPPALPEPVIEGFLRPAEVCTVIAAPKSGKSWLTYGIAYAVSYGLRWFGRDCRPGKVLMIDNELQPATLRHRLHCVYSQLHRDGLISEPWTTARQRIEVVTLRGQLLEIDQLVDAVLADYRPGEFQFITLDALYRMLPAGISENDNAGMAGVYNQLDRLASTLGAAVLAVHHSSKGDQSTKSVTDVGSGAGAISRAADSHLILREHEVDGVYVLDGVQRSFPPAEPLTTRFDWPLWRLADGFDPSALRKSRKVKSSEERDEEVLHALRSFQRPASKEDVRGKLKFNGTLNTQSFGRLYDEGRIRPVDPLTGQPLSEVPASGRALWEPVHRVAAESVVSF